MSEVTNQVVVKVDKPMEIMVFTTLLDYRPKVQIYGVTRADIEKALDLADISHNNFQMADGKTQTTLDKSNSLITLTEAKDKFFGIIMLTPKNNKAGADKSFRELRQLAKADEDLKEYFTDNTSKFNKDNWTRLSTQELNSLYNEYEGSNLYFKNIVVKKAKFKYIPELDVNSELDVDSDFDVPALDIFNIEHELKEMKAMLIDLVNRKNVTVKQKDAFGDKLLKIFKEAAEEFVPEELKSTATSEESNQIQDMIAAAEARFASASAEVENEYDEDEDNEYDEEDDDEDDSHYHSARYNRDDYNKDE